MGSITDLDSWRAHSQTEVNMLILRFRFWIRGGRKLIKPMNQWKPFEKTFWIRGNRFKCENLLIGHQIFIRGGFLCVEFKWYGASDCILLKKGPWFWGLGISQMANLAAKVVGKKRFAWFLLFRVLLSFSSALLKKNFSNFWIETKKPPKPRKWKNLKSTKSWQENN